MYTRIGIWYESIVAEVETHKKEEEKDKSKNYNGDYFQTLYYMSILIFVCEISMGNSSCIFSLSIVQCLFKKKLINENCRKWVWHLFPIFLLRLPFTSFSVSIFFLWTLLDLIDRRHTYTSWCNRLQTIDLFNFRVCLRLFVCKSLLISDFFFGGFIRCCHSCDVMKIFIYVISNDVFIRE